MKVRTIKRLRMRRRPAVPLDWVCIWRETEVQPLGGPAYVIFAHPDVAADLRARGLQYWQYSVDRSSEEPSS